MTAITITTVANVRALTDWGAIVVPRTAGEAITVGDTVTLNSSGNVVKTDSDDAALAKGYGIVTGSGDGETAIASGDVAEVCIFGPVAGFASLAEGDQLFVSATAGKLDTAAGTVTWRMGYNLSSAIFFVLPGMAAATS